MDRQKYSKCVGDAMRGKKFSPGERKREFCIASKLCSGKTSSRDQANEMCEISARQPKPPKKTSGKRKANCANEMVDLADCAITSINLQELTADNFPKILAETLQQCGCGKVTKPTQMEKAMKEITPEQMEALSVIGKITEDYEDTHWGDNFALGAK